MTEKKLQYIEEAGMAFELFGMTRMAGRILGYLIVSDKECVSFNEIMDALKASKGSISGTTKQLITIGFVEPVSLPGDRKTYYRISNLKVGSILKARIQLFLKFADVLDKGRSLKEKNDRVSEWTLEVSSFYKWFGDEIDLVLQKWEREKENIIKQKTKDYENKQ
jgi:DNA-binding transcriptional regulator GbsR (MarR family)